MSGPALSRTEGARVRAHVSHRPTRERTTSSTDRAQHTRESDQLAAFTPARRTSQQNLRAQIPRYFYRSAPEVGRPSLVPRLLRAARYHGAVTNLPPDQRRGNELLPLHFHIRHPVISLSGFVPALGQEKVSVVTNLIVNLSKLDNYYTKKCESRGKYDIGKFTALQRVHIVLKLESWMGEAEGRFMSNICFGRNMPRVVPDSEAELDWGIQAGPAGLSSLRSLPLHQTIREALASSHDHAVFATIPSCASCKAKAGANFVPLQRGHKWLVGHLFHLRSSFIMKISL